MAQWGITGLKYFSHLTFGSGYFDFPGVCHGPTDLLLSSGGFI